MSKEASNDPGKVQLKDVRLSYPHLFRPQSYGDGEGEPAYSANFLIDKKSPLGKKLIDQIEDAIEDVRDAKWGKKQPSIKRDKIFFKDADDEDDTPEENVGMMVLTARNYKQPKLFDRDKREVVEADGIPYAGCYVDVIVRIWCQDNKYGKRINCSLEAVRFRRDGEPFGAAPIDVDEFDDLDEEEEAPKSRRRSRDEDEEEEAPKSRRRSREEDDEEEAPKSRRRSREEDDEDRPSRNARSRRDHDV